MNFADYVVIGAVVLLAALALVWHFRRRKAGRGCAGGCAGCAMAGRCPREGQEPPGF